MIRLIRQSPATLTIAAITTLFFALEYVLGGTLDINAHVRMGALIPERVTEDGELWRLLTPMLLHAGPLHFGLNMLAFLQLGAITELVYGWRRMVLFYVFTGLGGTLATTLFSLPIGFHLGASGAIMGLAGVLLGATLYGEAEFRSRFRHAFRRQLLFGVGLTFALGIGVAALLIPIVDNWGHGGGFVAGLLVAAVFRSPDAHPGLTWFGSATAVAAAVAAVIASGLWGDQAMETVDDATTRMMLVRAEQAGDGVLGGMMLAAMVASCQETDKDCVDLLEKGLADKGEWPAWIVAMSLIGTEETHREAMVGLERWLLTAPMDPAAHNAVAWHIATAKGLDGPRDLDRALALSTRSLELLEAGDTWSEAQFRDTWAEVQFQRGHLQAALDSQQRAVELIDDEFPEDVADDMRDRLAKIEAAM